MITTQMPADDLSALVCKTNAKASDVYNILRYQATHGFTVSSTTFKQALERNPGIASDPAVLASCITECIKGVKNQLERVPAIARSWSMIAFDIGNLVVKAGDAEALDVAKSSTSRKELFDLAHQARLRSDRILEAGPESVMAVVKVAEQIRLLDEILFTPPHSLESESMPEWRNSREHESG